MLYNFNRILCFRRGGKDEKNVFWRRNSSREKLSHPPNLSAVDIRTCVSEELSYRHEGKGRRVKKSMSFEYLKDKVLGTVPTPPRSRKGSQMNINDSVPLSSISFISDDDSNGSRVGFANLLGRKQGSILNKLWISVCQGNFNRVKQILESSNVSRSLYSENIQQDDLTLLDIAMLTNHDSLIYLLAKFGFRESPRYTRDPLLRIAKFQDIIIAIERDLINLSDSIASVEGQGPRDLERKITFNENKLRFYRVVNFAIQTIGCPSSPTEVLLSVRSNSSLQIKWSPPAQSNGAVITRYLVQWERRESQFGFEGEHLISCFNEQKPEMKYTIEDLCPGVRYFVRVSAANVKGWSEPTLSKPPSAAPSNWRDWSGNKLKTSPNSPTGLDNLEIQTSNIIETCRNYCFRITNSDRETDHQKMVNKLKEKGSAISRFFKAPLKFTRQVHASFYLGILLYTDNVHTSKKDHYQILLTPEGCVPIIQLEQSISNSLLTDNHVIQWLSLVISQWDKLKDVVYDIAGFGDSNSVVLRRKLLKVIFDIQDSLCLKNIGSLHYTPIEQSDGATIYCLVSRISDVRSYQATGGLKWSYIPTASNNQLVTTKFRKESKDYHSIFSFMNICPEILEFHQKSRIKPRPGLYLSLFKLRSDINHLSILSELEDVILFPSVRIRDNSNISKEEWIWIQSIDTLKSSKAGKRKQVPDINGTGSKLQNSIRHAWQYLRTNMDLSQEQSLDYRLYTKEVIELNDDISILFVLPSPQDVVTPPGSHDQFASNARITAIPLPAFKQAQLSFFNPGYYSKFTTISCLLDILGLIIGQKSKEAFTNEELSEAKNLSHQHAVMTEVLREIHTETNWIARALNSARDKDITCGVSFTALNQQIKQAEQVKPQDKSIAQVVTEKRYPNPDSQTGIIRVYPLYETGLAKGTSVKISCTHLTTAREIVHLVVQQLHSASVKSGHSNLELTRDQLDNFSLLCSVGKKARLLNEADQPLILSDPWKSGKLYVTSKSEDPTSTTV